MTRTLCLVGALMICGCATTSVERYNLNDQQVYESVQRCTSFDAKVGIEVIIDTQTNKRAVVGCVAVTR